MLLSIEKTNFCRVENEFIENRAIGRKEVEQRPTDPTCMAMHPDTTRASAEAFIAGNSFSMITTCGRHYPESFYGLSLFLALLQLSFFTSSRSLIIPRAHALALGDSRVW